MVMGTVVLWCSDRLGDNGTCSGVRVWFNSYSDVGVL